MDNIVTDLRIKISALEIENAALKRKIDQMYKDWLYDTNKYTELKELVKELTKAVPTRPCAKAVPTGPCAKAVPTGPCANQSI